MAGGPKHISSEWHGQAPVKPFQNNSFSIRVCAGRLKLITTEPPNMVLFTGALPNAEDAEKRCSNTL